MRKTYKQVVSIESIIARFKDNPGFVVLDSQTTDQTLSKYSIITFNPKHTISYDQRLLINNQVVEGNVLDYLDTKLSGNYKYDDLPFNGGFVGVIRYQYLEDVFGIKLNNQHCLPKVEGGIYDSGIIIDHLQKTTTIFNQDGDLEQFEKMFKQDKITTSTSSSTIEQLQSKADYITAISKTKDYIKSGDVYEINYTTGFSGKTGTSGVDLFLKLKASNPAPFAAYLKATSSQIISSSPELFFERDKDQIWTQPMKGTMPRGNNKFEDETNKEMLKASAKDKTELTMIVDLMRNDLSKICEPSSVEVRNPFAIKSYPTVFQQVADINGKLVVNIGFKQIINSLFPSGSITGAPKLRAIEVIDELESRGRETYTGVIGFYSYNQKSVFNVAIRTIDLVEDVYTANVGGAIVWDSTASGEYEECLVKAKAMLSALGVDDE